MDDCRARDGGVTLIEVLVVLSVIAVSAGVVTLALPDTSNRRSISQEADLLAARLNLAAQRSVIEGRHIRFAWEQDAYRFREWTGQAWRPMAEPSFPGAKAAQLGAALTDREGARHGQIRITPDLLPPTDGVLEIDLSSGPHRRTVLFDGLSARVQEPLP